MATPYATPEDVATRLNAEFDDGETSQVEAFLRDISAVIRNEVPDLDTRLLANTADPDLVVATVFQVIRRVLDDANVGPAGTTKSEEHPEYSYSIARALSTASAEGLDLTDAEIARLSARAEKQSGKAFSIIPG